ncbi:MAG: hypothetical protein AAFV47_08630 [Pseudomonadota bacterium]
MELAIRFGIALAICFTCVGEVGAQQPQGDSSARLRLQVNQLSADNGRLNRENSELQQQIAALTKQLEAAEEKIERTESRLGRAENTAQRFREVTQQNSETLDLMRERERELVGKFRETINQLRDTERARAELETRAADLDISFQNCAANNREMFEVSNEILDVLDGRGLLKRMGEREPFTQLSRVRLENLVDEYRYALEDELIDTPESP